MSSYEEIPYEYISYVAIERREMRTIYEKPELEVITIDAEDIIVTSTPDENEGPLNPDF